MLVTGHADLSIGVGGAIFDSSFITHSYKVRAQDNNSLQQGKKRKYFCSTKSKRDKINVLLDLTVGPRSAWVCYESSLGA